MANDPNGPTPDECDNVEWLVGPDEVTPEVTARLKADQKRQLEEGKRLIVQEKAEAELLRRKSRQAG